MVVINEITPVRVAFSVPAALLPAIRLGQARGELLAEAVTTPGAGAASASGSLTFIDNTIDQTTSGIRLKATFPNADRRLWPGDFVQVRLRVSSDPRAIVTPLSAVQNGPQGQYVYVVQNETAQLRLVTVGRTEGAFVVIREGLQPGDVVVTDGQLRLTPGARVSIPRTGAAS
jgi:multidrug efflux system membrane fusion protein